ncbi:MAG: ybbC [Chlamydiia bacterium]|nr:ybbC [Chlamydiia bacterium]
MRIFLLLFLLFSSKAFSEVELGIDRVFTENPKFFKGKKVGLITNHTGVNSKLVSTIQLFTERQKKLGFTLVALFAPEHGIYGEGYAAENIVSSKTADGIPIHSLHGTTRRPTKEMLKGIDIVVFDIQDIGSRSYTYQSTLYYMMEAAAKEKITVIVLDRPNPINGEVVDGPMLDESVRSFVGYINVPYVHGMTIGELAQFFNEEYKIDCDLKVVAMKNWKRSMSFSDTGLSWIPTSPNIPDAENAALYPVTGPLGEFSLVSIGIGYTLPFRVVAAPWINSKRFAEELNKVHLPGVKFLPTQIRPFMGSFSGKSCKGVLVVITDKRQYLPVTTLYHIMATLKSLYPVECKQAAKMTSQQRDLFIKVLGTQAIYDLLLEEKPTLLQFRAIHQKERKAFLEKRKEYLFPEYG